MIGLIQVTATKGRKTISGEVYGNLSEVDTLKARLMNRNKIVHSERSSWKLDNIKMNKEIEEIKPYSTQPAPFKFRDYQLDIIDRACEIIDNNRFVYLAMEVRTGKTLTSLGIANKLNCSSVLFLTKKKAISSIEKDFRALKASYNLLVINYESIHKIPDIKWDLIVCDEAHSMGAFPKPSKRAKQVRDLIYKRNPCVIFLSGTPTPESFSFMSIRVVLYVHAINLLLYHIHIVITEPIKVFVGKEWIVVQTIYLMVHLTKRFWRWST